MKLEECKSCVCALRHDIVRIGTSCHISINPNAPFSVNKQPQQILEQTHTTPTKEKYGHEHSSSGRTISHATNSSPTATATTATAAVATRQSNVCRSPQFCHVCRRSLRAGAHSHCQRCARRELLPRIERQRQLANGIAFCSSAYDFSRCRARAEGQRRCCEHRYRGSWIGASRGGIACIGKHEQQQQQQQ